MLTHTSRRGFLGSGALVATGATFGALGAMSTRESEASGVHQPPGAERRLRELNIELPPSPKPVATYVPAVQVDNVLYVSGHGPRRADGALIQGKAGGELNLRQANAAARVTGLNVLSTVRNTLGSLDKVVRLVKVLGMVNATADFTDHPKVINGFSDLMVEVFGESAGKGARSAVGMGSLPSNITVEIEAIFQVRS